MAIFLEDNKEYIGVKPVFWIEPVKKDVMGYRLTNVTKGQVILPGTPLQTDEAAKTAVVCKYAVVETVASDKKTLTVAPGHYLTAADKVAISGADTLTSLNLASVEGETIVLSAQNSTIKAGDVLVEVVTADGGTTAKNVPNRIVVEVANINEVDKSCSATHEAWVNQNMVNYPEEYLNKTIAPGSIYLKGCLGLKFTYQ
jgi:hypothetical protein